jgi:hypothetical protein
MRTYVSTHTYIHNYIHTCVQRYIHIHTYIHTYIDTATYIRKYTYTHIICFLGVLSFRTTHFLSHLTFYPMLMYPNCIIFTQGPASFPFLLSASPVQPTSPIRLHFNIVLPSVLLPYNFLLPSDFRTQPLCVFRFSLMRPTSVGLFSPNIKTLTIFSDEVITGKLHRTK